jgi:thiamine monophosphate synthase
VRAHHVLTPPSLVAITPGDGRDLVPWVRALAAAGLQGLLIREPGLDAEGLQRLLAAAAPVPWVAIHHRTAARPPGLPVHLPSTIDPSGWGARGEVFGVSCHDAAAVDAALAAGAAWVLLSPVWPPTSKPDDDRETLGLARFVAVARDRPVLALGGVTPERFRQLRERGGRGAAVLGDLFGLAEPAAAAARLRRYVRG